MFSADGEVLDLGMAVRLATREQRIALVARSKGQCEFPGCDAPHQWCDAHHLDPYRPSKGTGPTDLSNLALICTTHHHAIHEGGFTLTRGPTGRLHARGPDGHTISARYQTHP